MNVIALKTWLSTASAAQRQAIANRAKTSAAYLYQLATGRRTLTAEVAAHIEQATLILQRNNPKVEALDRTQLCVTCRNCPYTKK